MEFLLALQFLTRIPVNIRGTVTEQKIARSMAYYPLVGLLVGALAALLHLLLSNITAGMVADLASIALLVLITGNLHLDGLMDTADGLGSGKPREQMLEIMRDSRVGSHGVVAGILTLLSKVVLLSQIPAEHKFTVLLLFPVVGRWSMVCAATLYPYARSQGVGTFTAYQGKRELIIASLITLILLAYFLRLGSIFLAVSVLVGTVLFGAYMMRRVGGMTGDLFGAINESIELLALFVLLLSLSNNIFPLHFSFFTFSLL